MMFIVTVKLPYNRDHDPKNKQSGHCPVNGNDCTDVTGAHHSVVAHGEDIDHVRDVWETSGYHVTRIEAVK